MPKMSFRGRLRRSKEFSEADGEPRYSHVAACPEGSRRIVKRAGTSWRNARIARTKTPRNPKRDVAL